MAPQSTSGANQPPGGRVPLILPSRGETGWNCSLEQQFGPLRWYTLHQAIGQGRSKAGRDEAGGSPTSSSNEERCNVCFIPPVGFARQLPLSFTSAPAAAKSTRRAYEHWIRDHCGLEATPVPFCFTMSRFAAVDGSSPRTQSAATAAGAYWLDLASCFAALLAAVRPGDRVLDLCSAPGGKALLLAAQLFAITTNGELNDALDDPTPPGGLLVCNEPSPVRFSRLKRNVTSRVPNSYVERGFIQLASSADPGSPQIKRFGRFDRILLDAPCSSDQHLLEKGPAALAQWSIQMVRSNSKRQLQLLKSAAVNLLAYSEQPSCPDQVATGPRRAPRIVYCTCALNAAENDQVVEKLLQAQSQLRVHVIPPENLFKELMEAAPGLQLELVPLNSCPAPDPSEKSQQPTALMPGRPPPFGTTDRSTPIRVEMSKFGLWILPDLAGCGPLYIACVERTAPVTGAIDEAAGSSGESDISDEKKGEFR